MPQRRDRDDEAVEDPGRRRDGKRVHHPAREHDVDDVPRGDPRRRRAAGLEVPEHDRRRERDRDDDGGEGVRPRERDQGEGRGERGRRQPQTQAGPLHIETVGGVPPHACLTSTRSAHYEGAAGLKPFDAAFTRVR